MANNDYYPFASREAFFNGPPEEKFSEPAGPWQQRPSLMRLPSTPAKVLSAPQVQMPDASFGTAPNVDRGHVPLVMPEPRPAASQLKRRRVARIPEAASPMNLAPGQALAYNNYPTSPEDPFATQGDEQMSSGSPEMLDAVSPMLAAGTTAPTQAADFAMQQEPQVQEPQTAPYERPPILDSLMASKAQGDSVRAQAMRGINPAFLNLQANGINPIMSGLLGDSEAAAYLDKNSADINSRVQDQKQLAVNAAGQQGAEDSRMASEYSTLDPASMANRRIEEAIRHGRVSEAAQIMVQKNAIAAQHYKDRVLEAQNARYYAGLDQAAQIAAEKAAHARTQEQYQAAMAELAQAKQALAEKQAGVNNGLNQQKLGISQQQADQQGAYQKGMLGQGQARIDNQAQQQAAQQEGAQQQRIMNAMAIDPKTGLQKMPGALNVVAKPATQSDLPRIQALVAKYKLPNTPAGKQQLREMALKDLGLQVD